MPLYVCNPFPLSINQNMEGWFYFLANKNGKVITCIASISAIEYNFCGTWWGSYGSYVLVTLTLFLAALPVETSTKYHGFVFIHILTKVCYHLSFWWKTFWLEWDKIFFLPFFESRFFFSHKSWSQLPYLYFFQFLLASPPIKIHSLYVSH